MGGTRTINVDARRTAPKMHVGEHGGTKTMSRKATNEYIGAKRRAHKLASVPSDEQGRIKKPSVLLDK